MIVVILAVLFLVITSIWTLLQVRNDYREEEVLQPETVASVLGVYTLHFGMELIAAWARLWPYSSHAMLSIAAGFLLAVAGLFLLVLGILDMKDIHRLSGLESGELVTSGIFRWSRHPQNTGWALILVGIGLVSRSWMALLLAAVFWGIFIAYVPLEEAYLESVYGEEYRKYQKNTWRYFGPPGKKPPSDWIDHPE